MGITTFTAAAILAFNALMANAQNYQCECDGLTAPVWKDCKDTDSLLSFPANDEFTQVKPSPARYKAHNSTTRLAPTSSPASS